MDSKIFKRNFALVLIIGLSVFLLLALKPLYTAILGSIILYTLFNPIYNKLNLCTNSKKRKTCALITLLLILLIVVVPIFIVGNGIVKEVTDLSQSPLVLDVFGKVQERFAQVSREQIETFAKDISGKVFSYLKDSFGKIIGSVANFFISLVVTFFLLYFMFVNSEKTMETLNSFIPFNPKNTRIIRAEFRNITYSMVVGSGLIALIQGFLVGVGFLIFGLNGAVLWGFIAAILAFLPVVGAPVVYVPAGLILLLQGNYTAGIGILAWGLILVSSVDTALRPIIGKKMADTHPLVTLIGVFIGMKYFGMIGIIIGPLLLSYFFLLTKMFREEYIK